MSLPGGPSTIRAGADLIAAMAEPSFYPHEPETVEQRETPISWVFLTGDLVYKVKKPVTLPFLDYGSLGRRRFMCEEEVRLNRRLAPDYYLGVRSIMSADGRFRLGSADERGAAEYVVEMRRLPLDRTVDRLLEAGELYTADIEAVARRLAEFHADAEPAAEDRTTPTRMRHMVDQEFGSCSAWSRPRASGAASSPRSGSPTPSSRRTGRSSPSAADRDACATATATCA